MKFFVFPIFDLQRAFRSANFWLNLAVLFSLIPLQQFFFNTSDVFPPRWRQQLLEYLDIVQKDSIIGVVDAHRLLHSIPPGYEKMVKVYPTEETAIGAFERGELTGIVSLPPDYYEEGSFELFYGELQPAGMAILSKTMILNNFPRDTAEFELTAALERAKSVILDAKGSPLGLGASFLFFFGGFVLVGGIVWFLLLITSIMSYSSAASTWIFHEKKAESFDLLFSSVTLPEIFLGKFLTQIATNILALAVIALSYWIFAGNNVAWQFALPFYIPFLKSSWPLLLGIGFGTLLTSVGISVLASLLVSATEATFFLALMVFLIGIPLALLPYILWSPDSVVTQIMTFAPLISGTALPLRALSSSIASTPTIPPEAISLSICLSLFYGFSFCFLGLALLRKRFQAGN